MMPSQGGLGNLGVHGWTAASNTLKDSSGVYQVMSEAGQGRGDRLGEPESEEGYYMITR